MLVQGVPRFIETWTLRAEAEDSDQILVASLVDFVKRRQVYDEQLARQDQIRTIFFNNVDLEEVDHPSLNLV